MIAIVECVICGEVLDYIEPDEVDECDPPLCEDCINV